MVSVLMCTYNRERLLKRAIDSVLGQTYEDLEFIIVDDGSTDGSQELIKSYQDERIRYFRLERNSYYCFAANYGLQKCEGEYVAFMNSDDIWELDKLEKQVHFMDENKEYGACFSKVTLIDDEEMVVPGNLFCEKFSSQKEYLQHFLKNGNTLCHPSALVRKELMDKVGGFHLLYCQLADFDLWIRVLTEAPVYVFDDPLVRFRWDMKKTDQISAATNDKAVRVFNEQLLIKKQLIDRLTDEQFVEYFGELFKNKASISHLELEFERAFLLMECNKEAPDLKVLGIEKLEQAMRISGAMETLRKHFGMDIFDLYQWNKEHMYKTPWLMNDFEQLKLEMAHKDNLMAELRQQLEAEKKVTAEQRELIDSYANSTSWKVTKPLRELTRVVKNIIH